MSSTPADPAAQTLVAPEVHPTEKRQAPVPTWRRGSGVWWRHALALLALAFALFPIVFIVSSAFNNAGTLSTSGLLPTVFGTDNFGDLFNDPIRPYWAWYRNSILICGIATIATLFLGATATAAYAFSRLRWSGRRQGLLFILLIQMFPALLAFTAIYVTFARVGEVLPGIGLNTLAGLTFVYLGGAMGSNIWLLKGYFDTVPREMDEAAKMDGASHARIFFTITLRLVTPILATVAVLASIPVVLVYLALQRQLVGGLTTGSVK